MFRMILAPLDDCLRALEVARLWQHTARETGQDRHYQVAHTAVLIALERYHRLQIETLSDLQHERLRRLTHALQHEAAMDQSREAVAQSRALLAAIKRDEITRAQAKPETDAEPS